MFLRILVAISVMWVVGCTLDGPYIGSSKSETITSPGPSLLITAPFVVQNISNEGVVTNTNHDQFAVSGPCKYDDDLISISYKENLIQSTTCNNGVWSASLDLSSTPDDIVLITISSGSYSTSLSLPRRVSPHNFDIVIENDCVGSSHCMHPSNVKHAAGSPDGLVVVVSCQSQKTVTLRSFAYLSGAWDVDTIEASNQSMICDRQGRARFLLNNDTGNCFLEPIGGGCFAKKCRWNLKADQNNQETDEEDIEFYLSAFC